MLVDKASRRFDLTPLDEDFLVRHLAQRGSETEEVSGDHKAQVQAQFAQSVDAYVASVGHAAGPDLEWLLEWGRERGAARVLDIATGGGHTALAFSRFTESVVAMDVTAADARGRAAIRRRPRARPACGSSAATWRPCPSGTGASAP